MRIVNIVEIYNIEVNLIALEECFGEAFAVVGLRSFQFFKISICVIVEVCLRNSAKGK